VPTLYGVPKKHKRRFIREKSLFLFIIKMLLSPQDPFLFMGISKYWHRSWKAFFISSLTQMSCNGSVGLTQMSCNGSVGDIHTRFG
jgi:hypothetical protein